MCVKYKQLRVFFNGILFAHDVTVAMLVVLNKSISLLWELKPYCHGNSSTKTSIVLTTNTPPTWPPCRVVASQQILDSNRTIPRAIKCKCHGRIIEILDIYIYLNLFSFQLRPIYSYFFRKFHIILLSFLNVIPG